jgi:hypothetical protein
LSDVKYWKSAIPTTMTSIGTTPTLRTSKRTTAKTTYRRPSIEPVRIIRRTNPRRARKTYVSSRMPLLESVVYERNRSHRDRRWGCLLAPTAGAARPVIYIVSPGTISHLPAKGTAVGLYIAGAGGTISRKSAIASLRRGKVENALLGGTPSGEPLVDLAFGHRRPVAVDPSSTSSFRLRGDTRIRSAT